jgi:hypothetical protein
MAEMKLKRLRQRSLFKKNYNFKGNRQPERGEGVKHPTILFPVSPSLLVNEDLLLTLFNLNFSMN